MNFFKNITIYSSIFALINSGDLPLNVDQKNINFNPAAKIEFSEELLEKWFKTGLTHKTS